MSKSNDLVVFMGGQWDRVSPAYALPRRGPGEVPTENDIGSPTAEFVLMAVMLLILKCEI